MIAAIEADGGHVVLLPEKSSPSYEDAEKYRVNFERNERILAELADLHPGTSLAPIERDLIPAEHFTDSLHVDATGHRMKAELLEPWVRAALTGNPGQRSAQSLRSR